MFIQGLSREVLITLLFVIFVTSIDRLFKCVRIRRSRLSVISPEMPATTRMQSKLSYFTDLEVRLCGFNGLARVN